MLLSSYVSFAAGLASSVITARALGPEEYGRFVYFVWLTGIIVVLIINGITVTLIRFISESAGEKDFDKASQQEKWLRNTLWKCIVFTSGLCLISYRYLGLEIVTIPVALAAALAIICAISKSIYTFDVSKAKGYGNFSIEPRISTFLALLVTILSGIALYSKAGLIYFIIIFTLSSLLHPLLSFYFIKNSDIKTNHSPPAYQPDPSSRNHLYWSALLCLVALSTNRAVETYILNLSFGPSEVGIFIVAATLSRSALELVSVGLNAVLMPVLGNGLGEGGDDKVRNITQRAIKYMFFIGLLLSGCTYFFADPLVLLLYGDSFKDAALAFKILTLTGGFTITSGIFGAYLSFTNRQQNRAMISLAGAIIQCIVAAAVVPLYGLWGAVASTSIGTFATFALLAYSSTRKRSLALSIKHFVSIFLIFLFAMLVVNAYYLHLSNITLKILSGLWFGIIFILLSIVFKYWQKADYAILSRVLVPGTRTSKIVSALEKYSP